MRIQLGKIRRKDEMIKMLSIAIAAVSMLVGANAGAAVSEDQVARLGKDLTPIGAERAGNAEGTIPEWTGGITKPPEGWTPDQPRPDIYAKDPILFSIDASNVDQYADKLSVGQIELIKRYKGYRMDIYATHRPCAFPEWIYERSKKNAREAKLDKDNVFLVDGWGPFLFPIPKTGAELIWNHTNGYNGNGKIEYNAIIVPTKSGDFTTVTEKAVFFPLQGNPEITSIEQADGIATYFFLEKLGPARLAGEIILVHELVNGDRRAWLYNPGQRRVRRAPTVAYDNPIVATESLMVNDQARGMNGILDRFDFKLIGKKEMYIPYDNWKIYGADQSKTYEEMFGPQYPIREMHRYELHRVWVVEATVRKGKRHLFSKRVFYIDEDSWVIAVEDIYDQRGGLWRVMEQWPVLAWEVPTCTADGSYSYDLVAGRYVADRVKTHEPPQEYNVIEKLNAADFTPDAIRNRGKR